MNPGVWREPAARTRMAELRREAEHERLARIVRSGGRGGKARGGSVGWPGWAGLVRAARIRPRYRTPWRGTEPLAPRGDQS
jgi:hypothetical protein